MRKILVAAVAAAMFATVMAAPVLADEPGTFTVSITFPDINPCTESEHLVTLNLEVSIHEHANGKVVGHVARTGTTDSGFVMHHGVESFVNSGNVFRSAFADQWRNPNGLKFMVHGVFVVDLRSGDVQVDRSSLTCIGH